MQSLKGHPRAHSDGVEMCDYNTHESEVPTMILSKAEKVLNTLRSDLYGVVWVDNGQFG